ncbi:MAG: Rab family GTPase [Promethearchaeota archaeon]
MTYYDFIFKVLILGDPSVGKIGPLTRYFSGFFGSDCALTIGIDFFTKEVELNGRIIKLQLWDLASEERFKFLLPIYCRGAAAAIILFDITNPYTLDKLSEWTQVIRENLGNIPIMLIGYNIDLEEFRRVSRDNSISMVESYNFAAFEEVSFKTGQNVEDIFEKLTVLLLRNHSSSKTKPMSMKNWPEFRINKYLTLRLQNARTNIYVGDKLFSQCKFLLLNIPCDNIENYDEIESIDEAAEKLDKSMEVSGSYKCNILPETEFWGHCSNLQAWYENAYDTRILHRNLAFPLLKALVKVGDPLAKKVFKEEIALRLESGYPSVVLYLINQGYLKYLNQEELDTIMENPEFIKHLKQFSNDLNINKLRNLIFKSD